MTTDLVQTGLSDFSKTIDNESLKEFRERRQKVPKSEHQIKAEKFECGNQIVLELLKGSCKKEALWIKLRKYSDVRNKVFWRMKYEGIIKLFKRSSDDCVIVLDIDSPFLRQPKFSNYKRFSKSVYSAIAKQKEENQRVRKQIIANKHYFSS